MLSNLPRSHSYGNRHHSPKIYGGKLHSFYSAPETSSKNQGEIYNNKRCQKIYGSEVLVTRGIQAQADDSSLVILSKILKP